MTRPALDERSVGWWVQHLGRPVDATEVRRQLGASTIAWQAAQSARRVPQRPAIRIGNEAVTHGELDDRARRLAAWLDAHGVRPGARVLIAAPNCLALVVAYLGTLHAGGSVSFANPMLTERELGQLVEDTDPVAVLAAGRRLQQLRDLLAHGDAPTPVLALEGDGPDTLGAVLAQARPLPVRPPDPGEVAHLAFTSGTTGRPKATPLTHANLLASIRAVMLAWRWSADDVLVHALPLAHGHGLSGVQAVLISGCSAVILPSFDPERLCREIAAHRATVLFSVPAIYERLLAWRGFAGADLSTLRLATTGSAPLAPATSDAVADILGHRPLERYGCTETGYTLSNLHDGPRRPGAVGWPLPGAEVLVVDDTGEPVADGTEGEIVARGPQVFAGYAGQVDSDSGEHFFDGAWFRTGDIGTVDPETGAFSITGRAKEVIITGGLNVYPREVELVLLSDPTVQAAAVVGVPSRRWGEAVTAFVVPAPGARLEVDDLRRRLRTQLAGYKCPKGIHLRSELPRNHMGKVLRAELVRSLKRPDESGIDVGDPGPT